MDALVPLRLHRIKATQAGPFRMTRPSASATFRRGHLVVAPEAVGLGLGCGVWAPTGDSETSAIRPAPGRVSGRKCSPPARPGILTRRRGGRFRCSTATSSTRRKRTRHHPRPGLYRGRRPELRCHQDGGCGRGRLLPAEGNATAASCVGARPGGRHRPGSQRILPVCDAGLSLRYEYEFWRRAACRATRSR